MDARCWTYRISLGWAIVAGLGAPGWAQTLNATGSFALTPTPPAAPAPAAPQQITVTTGAGRTTITGTVTAVAPAELPAQVFGEGGPKTANSDTNAAAKADPKAAEEAQKKQIRLGKIQQLNFDRRPSAILKAWSITDETYLAEAKPKPPEAGAAPNPQPNQPAPPTPDPFDEELLMFRRHVTKGDWSAVAKLLGNLPEAEGKAAYRQLVMMLPNSIPFDPSMMQQQQQQPMMVNNTANGINFAAPRRLLVQNQNQPMQNQQQGNPQFAERTALIARDVVAVAEAAPYGREKDMLASLANLVRLAIERGDSVENFIALVQQSRAKTPPPKTVLSDREMAKILLSAGQTTEIKPFLPDADKAEASNDREALNLLSQLYLATYAKEKKAVHLEQAWKVTLAVLAVGEVTTEQKDEALKRAVELAPKVGEDLGLKWLEASFTTRPERGKEIIAAIGTASSRGLQMMSFDADGREKALELQKTAVEALLRSPVSDKVDPTRTAAEADWSKSLALLAGAWLAEAEFSQQYDTSTSFGPRMQRDMYGNFFYNNAFNNNMNFNGQNGNFPQAISVPKILANMPTDRWLAQIDAGVRPKYAAVASQLYLKVGEDEKAFPHVENLARTHPERARALAEEFLRVWTRNHDPNAERNMRNPYIYMFGFERKAESIPLTRSKQERNLKELAQWVARLRKLPIRELDEKLISQAFTACYSSAEVYRLDAIESVLGNFDMLKPATLAEMAEQMRTNLSGLWRNPAVQDQNKTKRKEKDIRAEVLRGYQVAQAVVDEGLNKHPGTWRLLVARASLRHDENNYRQEIDPNIEFSKRRKDALNIFGEAASQYAAKVSTLAEDEETIDAYLTWFYAGLGSCDLAAIGEKNQPDPRQPDLIRRAILALPGAAAGRHMDKFANALFTRMSALSPAIKFRYLKAGFEVVGDNEQASEAKKVYDYYKDLVTEIKLEATVDGSVEVGTGQPFGLFVNLKHTREIERESGGFGRYLQNQNTGNNFSYNYGRPLENYRDKFQDVVKQAFEEQFEILSVTFQDDKVNSRATPKYGWRYTPYAYILMKAKSPKVDKIPPVRLDLDFLDTSGYVIMPVESPAVPIDAATVKTPVRPFEKLQITETLDERQAKEGKLILEVKASALGLVPPLEEVVSVQNADFKVTKTEDQGLAVSKFDPDGDANAVISERTWLVTMEAADNLAARATKYSFPRPKVPTTETVYQRFIDADLARVEPDLDLEAQYGEPSRAGLYWTLGGLAGLVVLGTLAYRFRPRAVAVESCRFVMPDPVTPFAVLGLLRTIEQHNGLPEPKKRELAASIAGLEAHYFAGSNLATPDLSHVATTWIGQAV